MLEKKDPPIIKRIKRILEKKGAYKTGTLFPVVNYILKRKIDIMSLVAQHKTPFYVFDQQALDQSIDNFLTAFKKEIPNFHAYYALKLNHHPWVVKRAVEKNMRLDVASVREIDIALKSGCKDMVYFSPGKTTEDIAYALKYADCITINIDSFNELHKIGILAKNRKKGVQVGVRIHTDRYGDWKKYGIHIDRLNDFWQEAKKYPNLELKGIHFHMSRNKDASFYETTIKDLGQYLEKYFSKEKLKEIEYIDFGGGFEIAESEGFHPSKTLEGNIIQSVNAHSGIDTKFKDRYYIREAIQIKEYASKIGNAIESHLKHILSDVAYYSEPGRFICNNAMHIVLSVVDVKDSQNVILDGGVNMVGWQRFEYEYFPLVNITQPSKKEMICNMWGNLCTTWDIWGYYCYAKKHKEGDIIVVPNQGALTYSLAQNFIQAIPPVYKL